MKQYSLWNAILAALASICLLVILAPVLFLMLSAGPGSLWDTLQEQAVRDSLYVTFSCGFLATLLGLLLGTPLAYLLARTEFWGKGLIQGIIDVPVVIPHPVAGIALLLLCGGWSGRLSPVGNWKGIVLAMFFVSVSLFVRAAQDGFRAVPRQMEWTSHSLGISPVATFFRVALPLSRQNLLAGSIMMWARAMSEFGSIIILAYHPRVTSIVIYDRFASFGLSHSLPVAVILIWLSVLLFSLMRLVQERKTLIAGH